MSLSQDRPAASPRFRAALLALLFIAPIQLIGTTTAMVWFPDATWAKVGFGIAKVLLMLAPLAWLIKVEKVKPRIPKWKGFPFGPGMLWAHATGVLIFVIIAGAYYGFGKAWIDTGPMLEKVRQMGLDNIWLYLAGALYWCTVNSMLEEYFWRWFIFSRLRDVLPTPGSSSVFAWPTLVAIVACGLLFTAHHVVALKVYFDWNITLLGSLGCFIGSVTWSILYLKTKNIYTAYVSHVYPDLIIFYIGWELIFAG
ncbi:MAG: CPBP family intramembrane glutamic endopeptidase [Planctomycetota bacterium]